MKTIKVAIAGASGYTGGELIRILLHHPQAEIVSLLSESFVGKPVASIHKDLLGECDLCFTDILNEPDIIFLCLGHGISREFLSTKKIPENCKIIDLGNDFRIENNFEGKMFIYGLSELFKNEIAGADYIANPGCFATAIILALSPLASNNILVNDIHIHAITGATGAGKQLSEASHFSLRLSNLSMYKPFQHQHLAEIRKTLFTLNAKTNERNIFGNQLNSSFEPVINLFPIRGDFARGIFAGIVTKLPDGIDENKIKNLYQNYFETAHFVHFCDSEVRLKDVVNTNKAHINIDYNNGYLHVTSVIDNLLKGASGQAVQNMNLMFGLDETCGLRLKASAF